MRTVQGAKLRVKVGFTAKFTPSGGGSDGGFWVSVVWRLPKVRVVVRCQGESPSHLKMGGGV